MSCPLPTRMAQPPTRERLLRLKYGTIRTGNHSE
jgi:hypothetical protein